MFKIILVLILILPCFSWSWNADTFSLSTSLLAPKSILTCKPTGSIVIFSTTPDSGKLDSIVIYYPKKKLPKVVYYYLPKKTLF